MIVLSKSIWRGPFPVLLALGLIVPLGFTALPVTSAMAACTSSPGPGVNWRRCYFDAQQLGGYDLTGAELRDATFQRSILDGTVFAKADGYRAKFISASLTNTDFTGARLQSADFTKADLRDAILPNTDLRGARFVGADLMGADLTGAQVQDATFRNANLVGATWIDGVRVCAEGSVGTCR